MNKALVINLFGGPGCGKSTTMAKLFADLKVMGYNVEMVSEFAKDLVYEQRHETMKDEMYIFAKQHHRLFRVCDKVDIIITDRPLLLTNIYVGLYLPDSDFKKDLMRLVRTTYNNFNNLNIYLKRSGINYQTEGRLQNLEEAEKIDKLTLEELSLSKQSYCSRQTRNYAIILDTVLDCIKMMDYED